MTADFNNESDWDNAQDESKVVHDTLGDHVGDGTIQMGYKVGSLTESLQAYYPLDSGSGTTAVDESNVVGDGTISGASWNGSGQVGSDSLSFNGSSDYVEYGDPNMPGSGSISFWFRPTSTFDSNSSTIQGLTGKYESGTGDRHIDVALRGSEYNSGSGSTGCIIVKFEGSSVTTYLATSDTSWTGGVWYHISVVFTGSEIIIYVDGNESNSTSHSVANPFELIEANWQFGRAKIEQFNLNNSSSHEFRYLDGDIDDYRLYNRPLSSIEITELSNLTSPSTVSTEDTLQ